MDRLDELAVFVAVLEAGGLAAAARKLRRSPPAVTRTLNALEIRVGVRLVERTTRKVAPTEAGRRLADEARGVLAAYEEAVRREEGGPLQGTLTVTAPVVFGRRHMTPVVMAFLDAHPQVSVELVLNDRNVDLIDTGVDVALRIGALADSSLVARKVGEVRRVLVASPDYLARRGTPVAPADLAGHDTIHTVAMGGAPEWRLGGVRPTTVRLAPRLTVNEVEATLAAVRAGHGIGRALSYQVAEDLASGRLVRLLEPYEPEALPVQLLSSSVRLAPAKTRAFLDHAAARLASLDVLRPSS